VNLLREGLNLPEFLWWQFWMLIKRVLRGAIADSNHRQSSSSCAGQAILYADNLTDSMAIEETERQFSWNTTKHGPPQPILKKFNSILSFLEVSRRLNAQQWRQFMNK